MHIAHRGPIWDMLGGCANITFLKSVYFTLFLGNLKSRKFLILVKDKAVVDAMVDMYYLIHSFIRRMSTIYTYLREASAVARSTKMGNARASSCGTSNKYRLSRFFYLNTTSPDSEESVGK